MKIFQYIAMHLQKGLNELSKTHGNYIEFSVRDMYDYIEPSSKTMTRISGIVSYSSEDILPIQGLDVLNANATVTFTCCKEMAYEVSDYIELYSQEQKGKTVKLNGYSAIPTFSTPTRSEIYMAGEIGEAIDVSFACSYVLVKNAILANQVTFNIDGKSVGCTSFEIGKTRTCPSDNQENNETVRAEAQTQTLAFTINAVLTDEFNFLMDEIKSLGLLAKTHTLSIDGMGESVAYKVILSSGTIQGQAGGALVVNLLFVLAKEK